MSTPNPGSDKAISMGCECPILDNHHGNGYMGIEGTFVYVEGCPVHRHKAAIHADEDVSGDPDSSPGGGK